MSENKTRLTGESVEAFLDAIARDDRRRDARALDGLLRRITGEVPAMWGPSIVGYGAYHYRYASGREGDFLRLGFAPGDRHLVLYVMPGLDAFDEVLERLGTHRTGVGCLYLRRLDDVDEGVLTELLERAWRAMAERYPESPW